MQSEASRKKKAAPLVFSKDMKGNFVWNLRSATEEDAKAACDLGGEVAVYMENLVSSIFAANHRCSVVCEASVKGTKEGEGFKGVVLGCAMADISVSLRDPSAGMDGTFVKRAELLAVSVSKDLPDPEDTKRKLVLGCLSKLKKAGVLSVTRSLASEDGDQVTFYEGVGFSSSSRGTNPKGTSLTLHADLTSLNPDPMKKIM
jgi:hypothetical protein